MSGYFKTSAAGGSSRAVRTLSRRNIWGLAALLGLAVTSGMTLQAAAQTPATSWTLAKIDVVSHLRPEAQVVAESYSAQGGDVEIVAHGEARYYNDPPVCPGGYERIHFHWEFPQDVTHIDSGEKRAVVVTARTLEVVKPCWGGFSDNSGIDVVGNNSWPYDVDRQQIDVDRVWTDGTNGTSSKGDGGTASPGIEFGNWPAKDGLPFAYFYVQLHTYLSQPIDYVYMYKNNAPGSGAAVGAMPPGTGSTNTVSANSANAASSTATAEASASSAPGNASSQTTAAPAQPLTASAQALKAALESDPSIETIATEAPAIVLLVQIEVAEGKIAAADIPVVVGSRAAAYRVQPAEKLWHDLNQAGTDYLNALSARVTGAAQAGPANAKALTSALKLKSATEQFAAGVGRHEAPEQALAFADRALADLQGTPDQNYFAMQRDLTQRALDQLIAQSAPKRPTK